MGFESAFAARRRLAGLAMSGDLVDEALAPSAFAAYDNSRSAIDITEGPGDGVEGAQHLDELAHDIVATPGAGGALLVAFAAQARALSLVLEAALRTQGTALPADVMRAVETALRVPASVSGLAIAWRP